MPLYNQNDCIFLSNQRKEKTMTTVYDKFDKHFTLVSAWVIVNEQGDQVGKMAAKYPKDGMGKLYLYLHLHGSKMVQVSVSGCGFDKLSVAICNAAMDYAKDLESKNDRDFIESLKQVNHNFSTWNKYGSYKFLQAI